MLPGRQLVLPASRGSGGPHPVLAWPDRHANAFAVAVSTRSTPSATVPVTANAEANELLVTDPRALLLGMLLDQQIG